MADDAIEAINDLHSPHIVQDLIEGRDPNDSRMSDRRSAAPPTTTTARRRRGRSARRRATRPHSPAPRRKM